MLYMYFDIVVQFRFILLLGIKHVRLLGFSFCLFSILVFWVRVWGVYACTCLLHAYAYLKYAYAGLMYT